MNPHDMHFRRMTIESVVDFIRSNEFGVDIYIDFRHPYTNGTLSQHIADPRYSCIAFGSHRALQVTFDKLSEIDIQQDGLVFDGLFIDYRVISGIYDTAGVYGHDFSTTPEALNNPLALVPNN